MSNNESSLTLNINFFLLSSILFYLKSIFLFLYFFEYQMSHFFSQGQEERDIVFKDKVWIIKNYTFDDSFNDSILLDQWELILTTIIHLRVEKIR